MPRLSRDEVTSDAMHALRTRPLLFPAICFVTFPALAQEAGDWPTYGGDEFGQRYSGLAQIDRDNVTKLEVVWEYHTGERAKGSPGRTSSPSRRRRSCSAKRCT